MSPTLPLNSTQSLRDHCGMHFARLSACKRAHRADVQQTHTNHTTSVANTAASRGTHCDIAVGSRRHPSVDLHTPHWHIVHTATLHNTLLMMLLMTSGDSVVVAHYGRGCAALPATTETATMTKPVSSSKVDVSMPCRAARLADEATMNQRTGPIEMSAAIGCHVPASCAAAPRHSEPPSCKRWWWRAWVAVLGVIARRWAVLQSNMGFNEK